jgi:hypothetical protein
MDTIGLAPCHAHAARAGQVQVGCDESLVHGGARHDQLEERPRMHGVVEALGQVGGQHAPARPRHAHPGDARKVGPDIVEVD